MILLWGRPEEPPLASVRSALAEAGAAMFFFDERRLAGATLRLSATSPNAGALCVDGKRLDLSEVEGCYFRPYGTEALLERVELSRRDAEGHRLDQISAALWAWADVTPALVLNRPSLMASNGSKPLQAKLLAAIGFEVPATLVTTDATAARDFIGAHGKVIYKSISATRSIVSRLGMDDLDRLDRLDGCPVQFQAYVPGVDVRVHAVGEALFACEVQSDADDYRYSGRSGLSTRIDPCVLPDAVAALCRRAAEVLGLPLCGIDLRRTPDGRWVAFEVNPSPGFSYFAQSTGAPIAEAIAGLLADGAAAAAMVEPRGVEPLTS